MNIILLIIITLLITLREGFQQADSLKHSEHLSKIWHILGFLIRSLLFTLFYIIGTHWLILATSVLIMWPLYNIACNIGRKQKWYYLSNSGIDKILRKIFFFIKFD